MLQMHRELRKDDLDPVPAARFSDAPQNMTRNT
jgi:hypothetical protein